MEKSDMIIYIAHSSPDEPATAEARKYLARFPDVEMRIASADLHPFPTSVKEITLAFMMKFAPLYDPSFIEKMKEVEKELSEDFERGRVLGRSSWFSVYKIQCPHRAVLDEFARLASAACCD